MDAETHFTRNAVDLRLDALYQYETGEILVTSERKGLQRRDLLLKNQGGFLERFPRAASTNMNRHNMWCALSIVCRDPRGGETVDARISSMFYFSPGQAILQRVEHATGVQLKFERRRVLVKNI